MIEWTDTALFDGSGRFVEYQGVGRDVTDRVRAENALQRYAQRLEILRQIDLGLIQGSSIQTVIEVALKDLRKLIPCQRATVGVFDPQLREGLLFAVELTGQSSLPQGTRVPIRPSTFEGLDARHMKIIDDIRPLGHVHPEAKQLADEGLISGLQVLLMEQERPIGSLDLLADTPGFFTAEYQEIALGISRQLALGIHQKQMAEALTRSYAEMEQRVIERTLALQATNDRLTAILNNSHDGILLVDRDLTIVQSNPAFDQLLLETSAERPDRNLLDYLDPETCARMRAGTQATLTEQRTFQIEISTKRADGVTVELQLGLSSIPGDGVVVTVHDITEWKRTERQLQYHASLQTNLSDAVIVTDMDLHIQSWNKATERIYGWSEAEVVGRVSSDVLRTEFSSPRDRERVYDSIRIGGWQQAEVVQHRKDGREINILGSVTVVKDENGQALGIVAINRDITERKQVEAALAESEARYRLLAENIEDIIMTFLMDRRITYFSQSSQKLLGYVPEEVVGRSHSEFIHPEDYPQVVERARHAIVAAESTYTNSFRLRHKGGHYIWYEVRTRVMREPGTGQVTEFVSVLRDITERKQAEEALRESESRYRLLAENVTDLVLRQSLDGTYLYVSPSSQVLVGYTPEEMVGRNGLDDIHPDDRTELLMKLDSLLEQQLRSAQLMLRFRHKDGHYIWLESSGRIIVSPMTGEPLELVASARDVTTRKQAEDALRESESRYRLLAENVTDLVIRQGLDGRYLYASPSSQLLVGYAPEEMVGRTVLDDIHPDDQSELMMAIRRVMEHQQSSAHVTFRFRHKEGHYLWLETVGQVMFSPVSGQPLELVASARDVTVRKQAEEALRVSEERLRTIVENIPVMISFFDQAGRFEFVNQFWLDQVGWSVEDLATAEHSLALFYPDPQYRQQVLEYMLSNASGWRDFTSQTKFRGERVTSWANVRLSDGRSIGIGQDITERKQAEADLVALSRRLQLATEAGGIGIWEWDVERDIVLWDDQMFALYGISEKDTPHSIAEVWNNMRLHPEDRIRMQHENAEYLAHADRMESAFRIFHPDRSIRHIRIKAVLLRDEQVKPLRSIGVNWDVTNDKVAEEALERALEEEKALGELKSRFVSMASHEFRNPLAAILAATETLKKYRDRMDEAQIDARLDRIQQQVEHLNSIVADILQLARIQSGRLEFKPALGDLSELCREIVADFESQVIHGGRLKYIYGVSPISIAYDTRLMRQTIINLVSNALKYSPEGKPVHLTLTSDGSQVLMTVQDQGIGIPAEDLKHLFEPFHRAANVGTISGTGLGLSITKQAVERHGGTITVESQIGVGTTFTIRLPIVKA